VELGGYGAITSVVVSRAGEIVAEEYSDGDASALRNTRSCTQTVAGMLTGIAPASTATTGTRRLPATRS
jgi:hypothetical protein